MGAGYAESTDATAAGAAPTANHTGAFARSAAGTATKEH